MVVGWVIRVRAMHLLTTRLSAQVHQPAHALKGALPMGLRVDLLAHPPAQEHRPAHPLKGAPPICLRVDLLAHPSTQGHRLATQGCTTHLSAQLCTKTTTFRSNSRMT